MSPEVQFQPTNTTAVEPADLKWRRTQRLQREISAGIVNWEILEGDTIPRLLQHFQLCLRQERGINRYAEGELNGMIDKVRKYSEEENELSWLLPYLDHAAGLQTYQETFDFLRQLKGRTEEELRQPGKLEELKNPVRSTGLTSQVRGEVYECVRG